MANRTDKLKVGSGHEFELKTIGNSSVIHIDEFHQYSELILLYLQETVESILNVKILSANLIPTTYTSHGLSIGKATISRATIYFVHEPRPAGPSTT
jgi:hypothetical protein